jgi:hypothetical protein
LKVAMYATCANIDPTCCRTVPIPSFPLKQSKYAILQTLNPKHCESAIL